MKDLRAPKDFLDSWNALYDYLETLQESLERGKPNNLRIIIGTLRLLIADKTKGCKGGLLRRLVNDLDYKVSITWSEHTGNTLEEFLRCTIGRIELGNQDNNQTTVTIEEFIRDEAQRSGSSHDDPNYQNIFGAVLRMGKTAHSDPYRGVVMSLALAVLVWGNDFYNKYAPDVLIRRKQVS